MKKEKSSKEKIRILSITTIIVVVFIIITNLPFKPPPIFIYNHTESIPIEWYLMLPPNNLKDGDIVGFDLNPEIKKMAVNRGWLRENDVMMKAIGAVEGERYEIRDTHQFYVQKKYVGQVAERDGEGRAMPQQEEGEHKVEPGKFLPYTTNPMSFDGRYYGTVPLKSIRFKAVRLWPF